jgi:hypothetical protein
MNADGSSCGTLATGFYKHTGATTECARAQRQMSKLDARVCVMLQGGKRFVRSMARTVRLARTRECKCLVRPCLGADSTPIAHTAAALIHPYSNVRL